MRKYLALAVVLAAACGTEEDERPATFELIALGVLAPSCGQVQCHSSTTQLEGYALDTLESAQEALVDMNVLRAVAVDMPLEATLFRVIIGAEGYPLMPPDTPLAPQDIALIREWLVAGAPGLEEP